MPYISKKTLKFILKETDKSYTSVKVGHSRTSVYSYLGMVWTCNKQVKAKTTFDGI
jgi:hypothetical protein